MAPPGTSVLPASSQPSASTARARPQARRKANIQGDDAAYHGVLPSSSVGTKRAAPEKVDGEPRVKRKRLEPAVASASASIGAAAAARKPVERAHDGERKSLVSLVSARRVVVYAGRGALIPHPRNMCLELTTGL